ncbi:hypothetical protein R6M67_31660, partial [Streptomyces sp. Wh19]|nr:hypothetical protein [Streptomyces sp. Wh19]
MSTAEVPPGRQPLSRPLQAVLILVRLLFAVTVVGALDALLLAASVDAVDGRLLGMVLYASLPGIAGFVLSFRVRTGGVWVWRGLLAVSAWLTLGALATLGDANGQGVAQLVLPVVLIVLLLRSRSRAWFRLAAEQRAEHRPFSIVRMIKQRRADTGQTAMEYLGMILVVVALIGGLVATGIGGQLTGRIQDAICQLTGGGCAPSNVEAGNGGQGNGGGSGGGGGGSEGATVTGGTGAGT